MLCKHLLLRPTTRPTTRPPTRPPTCLHKTTTRPPTQPTTILCKHPFTYSNHDPRHDPQHDPQHKCYVKRPLPRRSPILCPFLRLFMSFPPSTCAVCVHFYIIQIQCLSLAVSQISTAGLRKTKLTLNMYNLGLLVADLTHFWEFLASKIHQKRYVFSLKCKCSRS